MTSLENVKRRAETDAKAHGYFLNPDPDFLQNLIVGLKENEDRYGFPSCPCRLASGNFEWDRDIICPCDYRDPDVQEYGACYCSLYVDEASYNVGVTKPIPERRSPDKELKALMTMPEDTVTPTTTDAELSESGRRLFYCQQCGYVTFREEPPYICPICRAKREMFAKIRIKIY